jgi:hypothetical protein
MPAGPWLLFQQRYSRIKRLRDFYNQELSISRMKRYEVEAVFSLQHGTSQADIYYPKALKVRQGIGPMY